MKVKELLEMLKNTPEDFEVILSSDAEGNSYSPASGLGDAYYDEENSWSGNVVFGRELEEQGLKENAVILWPVN